MGLCQLTWTPNGILTGLGVVRGLVVFPHADAESWASRTAWFAMAATVRVGVLGIGERTGVISPAYPDTHADGATATWQVIGEREVRWLEPGAGEPSILVDGETIDLPA
jgi:hypothetical protein